MNRMFGIVLAIFVGIGVGICFLLSINNGMQLSIQPLRQDIKVIDGHILDIKNQLSLLGSNSKVVEQLSQIEKRLASIEQKAQGMIPQPAAAMPPQEDFTKIYDIDISKSYASGPKNAPVTIIEFTDFQCPYCARFHKPLQEAIKAFPGKIKHVIKNFPLSFHEQAMPAAKAALAAGEQGKYFEMADALLENHKVLGDALYKELAAKLGLNVKKFEKDLQEKNAEYEQLISEDLKIVDAVDVRGTPTYFINGRKTMARDLASFKQEIDKILTEKK